MHKDYKTLKNNNINVHSVKTDAFIIDRKNIDKAKTLIKFSTKRGGWRAEDSKQVSPPSDIYKIKVNELSEIPKFVLKTNTTPKAFVSTLCRVIRC